MKKSAILFVIIILFISAALCTANDLGSAPVTISFWHCASDNAGLLVDRFVSRFNESNPWQITVKPVYQGQYADATTLMKTILSAEAYSELPDIMQMDATGRIDYAQSERAFPITDAEIAFGEAISDAFPSAVLENWKYQGVQLGVPFAASTTITYYNKDLLAAAGWETCPQTFREVIDLAADLKTAGISVPAFGTIPNTPMLANWLGQMGSDLVNHANGNEGPATGLACVENGALERFLEAWKEMADAGAVVNEGFNTNRFIAGEVALYTTSSSSTGSILEKTEGKFEVGTAPFLRVSEESLPGAGVSGSCLVLFDSEDDLKKAAAWEFLKYMISESVQAEFAVGTGYAPACTAALESPMYREFLAQNPQYTTTAEQLALIPANMRSVTVGPAIDFYNTIMNDISDMLTNGDSPAEGAGTLAADLQALLDNWVRLNE